MLPVALKYVAFKTAKHFFCEQPELKLSVLKIRSVMITRRFNCNITDKLCIDFVILTNALCFVSINVKARNFSRTTFKKRLEAVTYVLFQ